MSDHISGPRALADPIADITDVYAFPSPERTDRLVLVVNTLPMAKPSDLFSDGLLYRFRLRPLSGGNGQGWRFVPTDDEVVLDCLFSTPDPGVDAPVQDGTCTSSTGESVSFRVNDPVGGAGPGLRVFAGTRWDPFIMDARAALATLATHELAFTDHGSIFLDGKNVLSLVIELDTALLGGASLVGVVAETLTRGTFNVRIERVGRPEVKNMMLAPKEFDQVNRDLEIRDLYNMEDAFHLGRLLRRCLPRASQRQPRLLGRPGRQDGLADGRRRQPPVDRAGARGLPRRRRHEAVRRAGLVPRDRARCPPR